LTTTLSLVLLSDLAVTYGVHEFLSSNLGFAVTLVVGLGVGTITAVCFGNGGNIDNDKVAAED